MEISVSPHIRSDLTIRRIMIYVIIALIPCIVAGVYYFGYYTLAITAVSVISALITEFIGLKMMKKKFEMDGSAIVTGLMLALILPPTVPLWVPAAGAVFAIAMSKLVFGGLGHNIFNPALVGRAFLMASWPVLMTRFVFDAVTKATPLGVLESSNPVLPANMQLFLGNVGGCIGETSVLAILIGAAILLALRIIDWRIPLSYIGTVFLLTWVLGQDPMFHVLAGGLMFGAVFMATDYVTNPMTKWGRAIFGICAGIFVVVFRLWGGMPEGVCYSILIMNGFTPLIDRYIKPRPLGEKKLDFKNIMKKEASK